MATATQKLRLEFLILFLIVSEAIERSKKYWEITDNFFWLRLWLAFSGLSQSVASRMQIGMYIPVELWNDF